jgi:hypothetical protein
LKKKSKFIAVGVLLLFGAWYLDFLAIPSALPHPLEKLPSRTNLRCYVCSLGGFIDREYIWRLDGPPDAISSVIKHLEMQESETIPKAFWRMRPYYWPRMLTDGMKPYRSSDFNDDYRGSDGEHFFLLHDTKANRAFVWFRDNF